MHIKEIVVDGFKSYAHRTVIAGYVIEFEMVYVSSISLLMRRSSHPLLYIISTDLIHTSMPSQVSMDQESPTFSTPSASFSASPTSPKSVPGTCRSSYTNRVRQVSTRPVLPLCSIMKMKH